MLKSIRRIGNALLITSLLTFSASVVGITFAQCGTGGTQNCLASLVFGYSPISTPDMAVAESTVAFVSATSPFGFTVEAVQLISVYGVVTAVLILIALECVELYYVRRILAAYKRKAT